MVNDGLLSLNDPIRKFLPHWVDVPRFGSTEITLFHLATHTSGLKSVPSKVWVQLARQMLKHAGNGIHDPYTQYTVDDLYEFLVKNGMKSSPGEIYSYSNAGYALLAHILTLRSGITFDELVKEKICNELTMRDTPVTLSKEQKRRLVLGHDTKGKLAPYWDNFTFAGAGGLHSSINDLVKFLLVNIGVVSSNLAPDISICHSVRIKARAASFSFVLDKITKKKSALMELGLGWHIAHLQNKEILWHNGLTGGFIMALAKDLKEGVVILSNSRNEVDKIGLDLLKLFSFQRV